jgi:hypothetical protein
MLTDVKSLLCAYNDAINDGCHDQVREFNVSMARANLDDISPELATEVIRLRIENARMRAYVEGIIPEMEEFNRRGCGRNCSIEGDVFDISEAHAAINKEHP